MCIGFPGQVVALDDSGATIESLGRTRRASLLLMPDICVGEWVYIAAGSIVARLDAAEAAEVTRLLAEADSAESLPADPANYPQSVHSRA